MADKSGQARVPTIKEQRRLFSEIRKHRHPEKNAAIMQISFCLGLRVQEISLLELKEVCSLGPARKSVARSFKLREIMKLPAAYTKGADALNRSKVKYQRKTVSFKVEQFDQILKQVEKLVKAGADVDPESFYPPVQSHKGKARDLPMVDEDLRAALEAHIQVRLDNDIDAKPSDRLFISQKRQPYSPNTLQEHMALMLRGWAGIEDASSHSGRRTLMTDIIHNQGKSVKVAQKIAGHVSAASTLIYEEPPEVEIADALRGIKK